MTMDSNIGLTEYVRKAGGKVVAKFSSNFNVLQNHFSVTCLEVENQQNMKQCSRFLAPKLDKII